MENLSTEGERPVVDNPTTPSSTLSNAVHVKPRMNPRRPRRKAKYSLVTDSEQVPRGKGEKNPARGVKQNLKPYVYKQWKRNARKGKRDRVPFA